MCDEHVPKKLKTTSPTSYTFHGLLQKLQNNDIDIRDYHFNIIRKANHKVTPDVITNPYPISIVYSDNTSTISPLQLFENNMRLGYFHDCFLYSDNTSTISPRHLLSMFENNTTYRRLGFEHDFFPTLFVEHVTIASSVKYLPPHIFSRFYSLKAVTFEGTSLKCIAEKAFSNCIFLQQITIPPTVNFIGQQAFSDCYSLFKVQLQNRYIKSIEPCTFQGCVGLKTITLPDSILALKDWCFKECSSLSHIALPPSLNSLGEQAFIGCPSLQLIYLPPSVEPTRYARQNRRMIWKFDPQLILLLDELHSSSSTSTLDQPFITLRNIAQIVESMPNNLDDEEKKDHLCIASMIPCCSQWLPKVNGMNMLHILCHFPSSCNGVLDTVQQLLSKCPGASQLIDNDGRTALHHIFEFNSKRDPQVVQILLADCNDYILLQALRSESCCWDVIEKIANKKINSLSAADTETGLVPFMFASIVKKDNLTVVFKLLLLKPDILLQWMTY